MSIKGQVVSVKPTVDTSAYASGDLIGDALELAFASNKNRTGIIASVSILDRDSEEAPIDVFFFNQQPTASTFTDNDPATIADADLENCIGVVSVAAADYATLATNSVATILNVGCRFKLVGSESLWAVLVSRGTPSYTAATDLTLAVGIGQDGPY